MDEGSRRPSRTDRAPRRQFRGHPSGITTPCPARSWIDGLDGGLHPGLDIVVGEPTVTFVGRGSAVHPRRRDRMLGVGNRPETVAVLDETVFFETFQRGADAAIGNVDGVDDFPLAKRLVGVFEEEAIHRTLGGVRCEVGKRGSILVDRSKLVFRDRHRKYWFILEAIRSYPQDSGHGVVFAGFSWVGTSSLTAHRALGSLRSRRPGRAARLTGHFARGSLRSPLAPGGLASIDLPLPVRSFGGLPTFGRLARVSSFPLVTPPARAVRGAPGGHASRLACRRSRWSVLAARFARRSPVRGAPCGRASRLPLAQSEALPLVAPRAP
jgi:hypothetical protein